jgi:DNA-binding IclR family transcriptional regulator
MKPATSIEKVCKVLGSFRTRPWLGVTQAAAITGLLPSDVHRILKSLQVYGFIEQDEHTRRYRLGLELLKLGHLVHARMELGEIARPFIRQLAETADATVNLAVFDPLDLEVVFVQQINSPNEVHIRWRIGHPTPPHATGVGKVLLAHLDRETISRLIERHGLERRTRNTITDRHRLDQELEKVFREGHAWDREEAAEGACCIAMPVHEQTGEVVAAVSLSMSSSRMAEHAESHLVSLLGRTAQRISEALAYPGGARSRRLASAVLKEAGLSGIQRY